DRARHQRGGGARGRGGGHVVVAVEILTGDGDEQRPALPGQQRAAVGGDRVDRPVVALQAAVAGAGDARELERPHARASRARRATSLSSRGWRTPRISWYGSCPLPATSTMSPGPAAPIARVMAAARSRSTSTAEASPK